MSIEQKDVIDAIGVSKTTGELILTISDHLDWEDDKEHILLLQNKINAYVHFVESGEILQSYPDSKSRAIVIDIVAKFKFSPLCLQFYSRVEESLKDTGIKLIYRNL